MQIDIFEKREMKLLESMVEADKSILVWFKLHTMTAKENYTFKNFAKNTHSMESVLAVLMKTEVHQMSIILNNLLETGMISIHEDTLVLKKFWRTNQELRGSAEYKEWRSSVFARDSYTCQICSQVGGQLNAHHIKTFADHEELRTTVSNGVTLCVDCHKGVHSRKDD